MKAFDRELGTAYKNGSISVKVVSSTSLSTTYPKENLGIYCIKSGISKSGLLLKEWTILSKIRSQEDSTKGTTHIIEGLDYWTEGETTDHFAKECLLLEAAIGGPLHRHIHLHGQIPTYRARIYSYEIGSALMYLHDCHSIVHRDLKASNILIDHRGHIKIADFGSAKILPPSGRTFSIVGTIHCMAPEMVAATVGYDSSVDYWALGILIYEMLTGQPPNFTWNNNGGDSRPNCGKHPYICSHYQSDLAKQVVEDPNTPATTDWHFKTVDQLLEYYPNPPLPRGDILNNMKTIEQRIAFEEVQMAHDLITVLLDVSPQYRLRLTTDNFQQFSWLKECKKDGNSGEYEAVDYDPRLGFRDMIEAESANEGTNQFDHKTDPFTGF